MHLVKVNFPLASKEFSGSSDVGFHSLITTNVYENSKVLVKFLKKKLCLSVVAFKIMVLSIEYFLFEPKKEQKAK